MKKIGTIVHCKDVSVREVGCELTESNIRKLMEDWTAYRRAEFIVLKHGDDYATLHLDKPESPDLFIRVSDFQILSLPKDTIYLEIPDLDVINQPSLARLQTQHPGKTVVVKGNFSHIVFFSDLDVKTLTIVDATPPTPAKMSVLVRKALDSGFVDLPIITEEKIISTEDILGDVRTENVMFPCAVSGLDIEGKKVYFLDDAPKFDGEITLIGCNLSLSIFRELYEREPKKFINICPLEHVDTSKKTITRCCKVREGHRKEGNMVKLPWGATIPEVVDAINDLFG